MRHRPRPDAGHVAGRPASSRPAGRGPARGRIPIHLAEVYARPRPDPDRAPGGVPGLAETVGTDSGGRPLYGRLLRPEGWRPYADTVPTLQALYAAGVPVAVLSNIGFDIRPLCAQLGFAQYVSAWALSYEVGTRKPDPAIFRHACRALGAEPERTLMVGDTVSTPARSSAGCRALILPWRRPVGAVNGPSPPSVRLALG